MKGPLESLEQEFKMDGTAKMIKPLISQEEKNGEGFIPNSHEEDELPIW